MGRAASGSFRLCLVGDLKAAARVRPLLLANRYVAEIKNLQYLSLRFPHFLFLACMGMIVAEQMQHAMDNEQLTFFRDGVTGRVRLLFCAGKGEQDVAEVGLTRFGVGFGGGKGKHIGRRVNVEMLAVEGAQLCVAGQNNSDVSIHALMPTHSQGGALEQGNIEGRFANLPESDHVFLGMAGLVSCAAGISAAGYWMRG